MCFLLISNEYSYIYPQEKPLHAEIATLLNKLTPTNMNTLGEKLVKTDVSNFRVDDLNVLANKFHQKACLETKYASTYAEFLVRLEEVSFFIFSHNFYLTKYSSQSQW